MDVEANNPMDVEANNPAIVSSWKWNPKRLMIEMKFGYAVIKLLFCSLVLIVVDSISDFLVGFKHLWNKDWWWGTLSLLIPFFPSVIDFLSYARRDRPQSGEEWVKEARIAKKKLPFINIYYHFIAWKNMTKVQCEIKELDLKLITATDETDAKDLEDQKIAKEADLEGEISYLHNFKVPEAFGESLPQAMLQIYIVLVQAGSLSGIKPYLDQDWNETSIVNSTYFGLGTSLASLKFIVSSICVEWYFSSQKNFQIQPTQGLGLTFMMITLMIPTIIPRILTMTLLIALPTTWWLSLTLLVIKLGLYSIGIWYIFTSFKKEWSKESFDGYFTMQFLSTLIGPCIWIRPDWSLLFQMNFVASYTHLFSLHLIWLLTYFHPTKFNRELLFFSIDKTTDFKLTYFSILILTLICCCLLSLLTNWWQWKIIQYNNFGSACAFGDLKSLKSMIQSRKNSNDIPENSSWIRAPYHWILRKMCKYIQFNEVDTHGETGFHYACKKGQFEAVKLLLENKDILKLNLNKTNKNGLTGFHWACHMKHDDIVRLILSHKSDFDLSLQAKMGEAKEKEKATENCITYDTPNCTGQALCTGLGIYFRKVCEAGDMTNLKTLMTLDGVNFNEVDEHGQSGFHLACTNGRYEVIKVLLENQQNLNLNLNLKNCNEESGFQAACYYKHKQIVDLLLKNANDLEIDLKLTGEMAEWEEIIYRITAAVKNEQGGVEFKTCK